MSSRHTSPTVTAADEPWLAFESRAEDQFRDGYGTDELAVKLAASEAELTGLKALLAEVKANRENLRQDRDDWRGRAERLLAGPQRQAWWRRLVG
jgi:hypothetical protein